MNKIILFALTSLSLVSLAHATPQEKFTELRQLVDELEAADKDQVARADLNTLRTELGAMKAHLKQGHTKSARRAFELGQARARLVTAKLNSARAATEARAAAQLATERAEEAKKLSDEATALEQKLATLEAAAKEVKP